MHKIQLTTRESLNFGQKRRSGSERCLAIQDLDNEVFVLHCDGHWISRRLGGRTLIPGELLVQSAAWLYIYFYELGFTRWEEPNSVELEDTLPPLGGGRHLT